MEYSQFINFYFNAELFEIYEFG